MASHVANVAATMDAEGGARRGEWVEMGCAQAERDCAQAERERVGTALNWAGAAMVAD